MLLKDLLQVLVTVDCYSIRIDTFNSNTGITEKNIFKITNIPLHYMEYKVFIIHTSDIYNSDKYQYFVAVSI